MDGSLVMVEGPASRIHLGNESATPGYFALLRMCRELQAVGDDLSAAADLIVSHALEILDSDLAWIFFRRADGKTATLAVSGARRPELAALVLPAGAEFLGKGGIEPGLTVVPDWSREAGSVPETARHALDLEGVASVAGAPLMVAGRSAGAVYTGMRRPTEFGSAHLSMLGALVEHGSIAIHNVLLTKGLGERNDLLRRSFETHSTLTGAGLREEGPGGVVKALTGALGRPIALEPNPATTASDAIATAGAEGEPSFALTIGSEADPLGRLCTWGAALSEAELNVLEHGAMVLAAELLRERSSRETEWSLQGELLEELVDAGEPLPESLRVRALRAGIDLAAPRRVVVVEGPERELRSAQRLLARHREEAPILAFQRGTQLVGAVPATVDVAGLETKLRELGPKVRAGIGRPVADLAAGFRAARACARTAARRNEGAAVRAESLAPFSFLFERRGAADQAAAMVREQLGDLSERDRAGRVPLLDTVCAYVDAGGSVAAAAEQVFVHPTTLSYRLDQAGEHLRTSLADLDTRYELAVAFQVLAALEARGEDPLGRAA